MTQTTELCTYYPKGIHECLSISVAMAMSMSLSIYEISFFAI